MDAAEIRIEATTKTLRRPVRSDSQPPILAVTTTATVNTSTPSASVPAASAADSPTWCCR